MDEQVLVVDLDGTLIKSDMLWESFFCAISNNWRVAFIALYKLLKGIPSLKHYLMLEAKIDIEALPYDREVVEYVRRHRDRGGQALLVTATRQELADKVADHLGIFDGVYGTLGQTNLKGVKKAEFLVNELKLQNFAYIGDSHADIPVWEAAKAIITVNASGSLRAKVESIGASPVHLITVTRSWQQSLKALRPHQWLKNILIFLPMLAGHYFDFVNAWISLLAFIAFSLVASSVYVLNDLFDLNADRAHPRKRLRPFASGAVPIVHGIFLAVASLLLGVLISVFLGWAFLLTLGAYYLLTTAYSLRFKRQIILDICFLGWLYTMRIVAGSMATGIELSVWLFAFSVFFFFSLAAVKRQAELVDMDKRGTLTALGRGYSVKDLPIISMAALGAGYISVLVMALYVNSSAVMKLYTIPEVLLGICFVLLYWLTRMVLITHRGTMDDDPVLFAARDRVSRICFLITLCILFLGTFL